MDQRKKKIYMILLIGGGVALFANYVLFPAEDTRPLTPVGATTVSLVTSKSAATAVKADAIPELVFPRKLPSWPTDGRTRDIFEAPFDLAKDESSSVASTAGSTTPATVDRTERAEFADNHHLQMVLDDKLRPIAVVDDQWLNLGDELDQCNMLSVKGTTATFECYDGKVLLELETSVTK